jgi:hypothetical protein
VSRRLESEDDRIVLETVGLVDPALTTRASDGKATRALKE